MRLFGRVSLTLYTFLLYTHIIRIYLVVFAVSSVA